MQKRSATAGCKFDQMKIEKFDTAALEIWQQAISSPVEKQANFELVIHKALLSYFMVGPQYHFVFNASMFELENVGENVFEILGYPSSEFNLSLFLDNIHPQDRPYFLNFENKVKDFLVALPVNKLMKYKVSHDFRIRKRNGEYARILQQSTVIEHDETGGVTRTFATHTDIGHIKQHGIPTLSIIGLDGEPSYINIAVEKIFSISSYTLTPREKEILRLLAIGKLSKQVAAILGISKQTVDKHRKNMLIRNKLNNTGELIGKAIQEGWL